MGAAGLWVCSAQHHYAAGSCSAVRLPSAAHCSYHLAQVLGSCKALDVPILIELQLEMKLTIY